MDPDSGPSNRAETSEVAAGASQPRGLDLVATRLAEDAEKNKRKQRAFRERQKAKRQELQAQLTDLEEQLQRAQSDREALQQRNEAIESMLSAATAATEVAGPSGSQLQKASPSGGAVAQQPPALSPLDSWPGAETDLTAFDGRITVRVAAWDTLLTQQWVQNLRWPDLASIWKAYVSQLADDLMQAKGDLSSPAGARLQMSAHELMGLCAFMAVGNPKLFRVFVSSKIGDEWGLSWSAEAHEDIWINAVKMMRLADLQKAQLIQLRRAYWTRHGALLRERQSLQARMLVEGQAESLYDYCGRNVEARSVADQFRENLREDQSLLAQVIGTCVTTILAPFQFAVLVVQAFPWAPDMVALMEVVAKEHQGQGVDTLMQMPVEEPATVPAWTYLFGRRG